MDKMKRLIECYVPVYACNMKCDYCYIKQNEQRHFENKIIPFTYSPVHMAKCLNKERLGGTCLINLCAGGETLLSHEVVDLTKLLLEEGHYVMIVSNGTITKHIKELCEIDPRLRKKLWFRLSFHYLELKRLKMLDTYFDNFNLIKCAGCSVSCEMVASDDYIPYIEEIKRMCMERIKSLPEINIARRESDFSTLTDLTEEEYDSIWGQFKSASFELKKKTVGVKRKEFCYAGDWTVTLDLGTGYFSKCYSSPIQNIFKNPEEKIRFEAIGCNCPLPYCHNSHIWMTFGDIPELKFPTFAEVRSRNCVDGTRWLTDEMYDFVNCKLVETNGEYKRSRKMIVGWRQKVNYFEKKLLSCMRKIRRRLR